MEIKSSCHKCSKPFEPFEQFIIIECLNYHHACRPFAARIIKQQQPEDRAEIESLREQLEDAQEIEYLQHTVRELDRGLTSALEREERLKRKLGDAHKEINQLRMEKGVTLERFGPAGYQIIWEVAKLRIDLRDAEEAIKIEHQRYLAEVDLAVKVRDEICKYIEQIRDALLK